MGGALNGTTNFADHPLWKLPNTYPFLRLDIRQAYNPDGTSYYAYQTVAPTPAQFADSVANLYTAYQNAYGAIFHSIDKPVRYGILLAGLGAPDCPIHISDEPRDIEDRRRQRPWCLLGEWYKGRSRGRMRRNRTMQGISPKLGSDNGHIAPAASFFHREGRARTRAWATAAFAAARSALDTLGAPPPELLLTDIEPGVQNPAFGYPTYRKTGYVPPANDRNVNVGWFDALVRQYPLQPQWWDYLLDGDKNFGDWLAQRSNTLAGSAIPPHDPNYYASNPAENDIYQRMLAVLGADFLKSFSYALYEPAKAAFGDQLKCGQYATFTNGRIYPTEGRPTLLFYALNGVFGADFQPASHYFGDPNAHDAPYPFTDPDTRWDEPENWRARLQMPTASGTDLARHVDLEKYSASAWGAVRSNTAPLFPATTVSFLVAAGTYPQYSSLVTENLCRSVIANARNIWMFEPEFNLVSRPQPSDPDPADIRAAAYDQALRLNARVTAMSQRRNRTARAGNTSFPYLAVNRP